VLTVEGIFTAEIVRFCKSSMKLRICENCIFVLPVSILTGVARRLLGPHDTLLCVLIQTNVNIYLEFIFVCLVVNIVCYVSNLAHKFCSTYVAIPLLAAIFLLGTRNEFLNTGVAYFPF